MPNRIKTVAPLLRGPFKKLMTNLDVVGRPRPKISRSTVSRLAPNQHYFLGRGAGKPRYEYITDSQGRIRAAYASDLRLKPDGQPRGSYNSKPPGKQLGDDAGHLFGDQFDGSGGLGNIVPQLRSINQGKWAAMEREWVDAIRGGKKVEVLTEISHTGNSARPSCFVVSYVIDGVEHPPKIFPQ